MYPREQSAELHKGPLWDAVVDTPIHHSQKLSDLRVVRHPRAVSHQEPHHDTERPLSNGGGYWQGQNKGQNFIVVVQPILPILCYIVWWSSMSLVTFFCVQASVVCMVQQAQYYPQHQ